ncbi:hypothetical protein PISMIDRAFT_688822 [Pisolithus microcarpus 441]|uniref:Uncharacterized protein n=1 Tax=Pisolithus microcarpus 441 TaxID=765257 RepID=A0A0C9YHI4_9AGAM|nr:hypothetical protein PISMIDRAFT_688822 [Pisolithus microcarpus 441]
MAFGCGCGFYSLRRCLDCQVPLLALYRDASNHPLRHLYCLLGSNAQVLFSVLQLQPGVVSHRFHFFAIVNYTCTSFLPGLEVCHTADRTSRFFLRRTFQVLQFNVDAGYGVSVR